MKKLVNAILMLSASLNRIASLIEKQNSNSSLPYQPKAISSHVHTSNPGYRNVSMKISSDVETAYKQNSIKIPSEMDSIAKDIYNAFKNRSVDFKHNAKLHSDLAKKWPTLFRSLSNLERHFDNLSTNKSNSDFRIWKPEPDFKDIKKRDI